MRRHVELLLAAAALAVGAGVFLFACGGLNYGEESHEGPDDLGFNPKNFAAQFYSVGLGDAILIETPGPHFMLVDGGSEGLGTSTICPDLKARAIDRIDVMAATHPDYDHIGGLVEVLGCAKVGAVWWNGETDQNNDAFQRWMTAVKNWGGPFIVKHEGDVDQLGATTIRTLHGDIGSGLADDNGLVFMVSNNGSRVLLTADIRNDVQQTLADKYGGQLACDVIKIPAHGIELFSQDFINDLKAPIAALSVGPNNIGYPAQSTLAAYTASGATIYDTEISGNIRVEFVSGAAQVKTQY